jgi:radical SAM protein with 4Fe4S-binding SPASM domain
MINVSKLYSGLAGQSDHLRYDKSGSLGPVVVYNCTARCNLRCLHCYSASDSARRDAELTTAQAKKLLADLVEVNAPVVLFSGGEPLLREDLFELLAEAKQLGLRTVLSTNGTLIDEPAAAKFKSAGVSYVGISIDGTEPFHNRFRQNTGAFQATIKGVRNCQKTNIRTGLRFTITKSNASQIPAVFDVAAEHGIRRLCFYHLIRSGRATKIENEILSHQQTRDAVDIIIQKTDEFVRKGLVDEVLTVGNHADGPYLLVKLMAQRNETSTDTTSHESRVTGHEAAKRLLIANGGNRIGEGITCVDWKGDVHPDQFWRNYSLGNVSQKNFKQIWTNNDEPVLKKLRNKSKFADKRCLKCRWFDLCKGNYRFLGPDPSEKHWLLEPSCYLTNAEIGL